MGLINILMSVQTRSTEFWFVWWDVHDVFGHASNQECNMVSCQHSCRNDMVYVRHDVPSKTSLWEVLTMVKDTGSPT